VSDSSSTRPLPAIHRWFPTVYYGWIVAFGCGALSFATVGIGFYGMAVFLDGLTGTAGFSNTEVAGPTSLYFMTSGLAGIFVGRFVDRHGARGSIIAGALVMAVCLVAIGRVTEARSLWVLYPVMALGFAASTSIPANAIVARWFVGLRARAMSISHSGVSLGGIVLVPWATSLIASDGLEVTGLALAGVLLLIALPVTLFVLRFDPADHGLEPDGGTQVLSNPLLDRAVQQRLWTSREALATRSFWLLALAFGLILFCQQGTLIHEIALLRERTGDARAGAYAVSVTAAASVTARLIVGVFADRIPKRELTALLMVTQGVALLGFAWAPGLPALYASAVLFGFTIGNVYMLQSLLVGELYGFASFGSVLGLLNLITQVMGGLGPVTLGVLHDRLGSYESALGLLAGVALAAAVVVWQVRPPPAAVPR